MTKNIDQCMPLSLIHISVQREGISEPRRHSPRSSLRVSRKMCIRDRYLGWSPIYILIAAAAIGISWTLLITKKAKK